MGYLGADQIDQAVTKVRVPLPAVPDGLPTRARDVLLNSGRVLDCEQQATFARYRRALRLLEQVAFAYQPFADILLTAASQMHGDVDQLTGKRWEDDEHKFVTVLLKGKTLQCGRREECHLGGGCAKCPFPAAQGVTLEGPSAVYAADASQRRVDDDAATVRLAATLLHEYTHVALRRMYDNVSLPRFELEKGSAADVDRRIVRLREGRGPRVSALMQCFDDMKPVAFVAAEENVELRGYLVDIATDWCTYAVGSKLRYQESVPYIVEAYFHAYRVNRPNSVAAMYRSYITGPFQQLVVPEFADFANVVRGKRLITDQ